MESLIIIHLCLGKVPLPSLCLCTHKNRLMLQLRAKNTLRYRRSVIIVLMRTSTFYAFTVPLPRHSPLERVSKFDYNRLIDNASTFGKTAD